jgi:iron(III) transport system permease protein
MVAPFKGKLNLYSLITVFSVLIIVMALSQIFIGFFEPASDIWKHIRVHLLGEYIINTLVLLIGTGVLSFTIGFFSAYIITVYNFKYRKLFEWLMILPLAMPTYIAAYIYADMFSYTGSASRVLQWIGINHRFDILSMPFAIILFAFTLYPYVYMIVKSSLKKQSGIYLESAKVLGTSKWKIIYRILLPLSRPAIVSGTMLVLLETLNDYGVVKYFGVRVFSFAIFDAWFRLGDIQSALRISGMVIIFVFIIITVERILRGKKRYNSSTKPKQFKRYEPNMFSKVVIYSFLSTILLIGFVIPITEIIQNVFSTYYLLFEIELLYIIINTVTISIFSTVIIIFIALMIVNFGRTVKSKYASIILKITTLGYAIPGAVIAITLLLLFIKIDNRFVAIYRLFNSNTPTLLLTSSLAMLITAYTIRFMTIAYNNIESSYLKIGDTYSEASYTLGLSKLKTLWKVEIPMIKPGLISAVVIVLIDIIKELPLTLILRPTNYDTIATKVYTYANDEMIQEASAPALILIILGSALIYYITHQKRGVKNASRSN